ncbi:MAG: rhodanese-like domain-containing protein [Saprospiraceae bacterium]|nr:rhodanese-like domain-containing protein [Saprospiraceae bacterium]
MKVLLAIFIFTLLLGSCTGQNPTKPLPKGIAIEPNFLNVDNATAKRIISQSKDLVIIDVRTPEEIALGKIGNALEMDIKSPDFKANLDKLDRNKQYLVYCHAGGRSANAMEIMKAMGFKQVYNLESGYRDWSDK